MKPMTKQFISRTSVLLVISLLLLTLVASANSPARELQAAAAATPLISYQGTLTDEQGNPISATVTMQFALYDASSGGTLKWGPETQSVQVTDGLFNVLLGSVTAINPANLTGDLWLDIKVESEQLTPRERLGGVLHAMNGSVDPFVVNGVIRSSRAADPNTAGALDLENLTTGNKWSVGVQAWNSDKLVFAFREASSGTWSELGGVETDGTWFMPEDLWVSGVLNSGAAGIGGDVWSNGSVHAAGSVSAGGSMAVTGSGFFGGATYWEGAVNLKSVAVPLTFEEIPDPQKGEVIGAGSLWRMPLDGKSLRFDSSDNGTDFSAFHQVLTLNPNGTVSCGAITENNLQTPEERAAGGSDRFEEGDLLCWSANAQRLEKCATPDDPLVQAVADAGGRPIVMGAEVVKVVGPVRAGDYLVASSAPGYAMVSPNPTFGIVIAQALEDFDGERGLIKAMIRKM